MRKRRVRRRPVKSNWAVIGAGNRKVHKHRKALKLIAKDLYQMSLALSRFPNQMLVTTLRKDLTAASAAVADAERKTAAAHYILMGLDQSQ